jgi:UDPglucose 6-dehydrogenase
MKIAFIGTGYVGLVSGTCLAESGNEVTCLDIDEEKISRLRGGEVPIYEPGLAELVERNAAAGRLRFTSNAAEATAGARLVFLAVGTPAAADGSADLTFLFSAVEGISPHLHPQAVVVIKSTVPVGTNARVRARLVERTGRECDVASNPEFLKEGAAINDFTFPDRVVVGVRTERAEAALRDLYAPFLRSEKPFLAMSPESAELTKYVANALLATKISFINEMANVCERAGADINDVRRGIGHDRRIGFAFLFPGAGYGGSCFPKDVRALAKTARDLGVEPRLIEAVDAVNQRQKEVVWEKIERHFGRRLAGRKIAVWGLSFKPRTDDIREAPAMELLERLLAAGAVPVVHDPVALENVRRRFGDRLQYGARPMDAVDDALALVIMTEWDEFRHVDLAQVRRRLAEPVVFDGRNLYEPDAMRRAGLAYYAIGRPGVAAEPPAQQRPLSDREK